MLGPDADDGVGDLDAVAGRQHHAGIAREVLVARDAADGEAVVDAGRDRRALHHLHGLEADVVGVLQRGDGAGAVEGDVELARKVIHHPRVEDVVVPVLGVGARVEQLVRVDAGRGRARHVADVVRARAARDDADVGQPFEEMRAALRLDLADLQVAARGHVRIAAAVAVGEVGDGGELPVLQDAVVHPHAAHVAVLGRPHIEEPMVAPAEVVLGLGAGARQRHGLQPLVGLERVFGPLPLLLVGELLAGRDLAILRLGLLGVGAGGLADDAGRRAADGPHGTQPGGEAVEPVLLV